MQINHARIEQTVDEDMPGEILGLIPNVIAAT